MPSTSDFLSDPYGQVSYPWEHLILRDWLTQYFSLLRSSPEVARALEARQDEFEMVPIPRRLITDFGRPGFGGGFPGGFTGTTSEADPDFLGGFLDPYIQERRRGTLEDRVTGLEKVRRYGDVVDLVRRLGRALESDSADELRNLLADDYQDFAGRTGEALHHDLSKLFEATSQRRFVPVHIQDLSITGSSIVATITGAWEAQFEDQDKLSSEFFKLELVITRDDDGRMRISSIKHEE